MIKLPEIIDAIDILTNEDNDGIDKIASKVTDNSEINLEITKIPNEKYASIIITPEGPVKKFPIDTRINTEMSIIALDHNSGKIPDELVKVAASNLFKAAEFYDIKFSESLLPFVDPSVSNQYLSIGKINERKYMEKTSSVETEEHSYYALNSKYPISTPELIKQAEEYFGKYEHKFGMEARFTFANNLLKQAEKLNVKLNNPQLLKYSHLSSEVNPDLVNLLKMRDRYTDSNGGHYTKVASFIGKVPLEKIAEAIYDLDKKIGLDKYYDTKIPDPVFTVLILWKKYLEMNL